MSRFAQRVSDARFKGFPCKMLFRGVPITGVSTSIKTGSSLGEAGFMFTHDGYARIPFLPAPQQPPQNDERITLFLPGTGAIGLTVRINEVHAHPNNPEWRLGLKCL